LDYFYQNIELYCFQSTDKVHHIIADRVSEEIHKHWHDFRDQLDGNQLGGFRKT